MNQALTIQLKDAFALMEWNSSTKILEYVLKSVVSNNIADFYLWP